MSFIIRNKSAAILGVIAIVLAIVFNPWWLLLLAIRWGEER